MLLVLGWRTALEAALDRLKLAHLTFVEEARAPEVPATSGSRHGVIPVRNCADIESVLAAALRGGYDLGVANAVHSSREELLVCAAALAATLGVRGPGTAVELIGFRDKSVQKQKLRRAGVRTARTAVSPARDPEAVDIAAKIGYPIVAKPLSDMGSHHVEIISGEADLIAYLARWQKAGGLDESIFLEEYIQGYEYHIDGVWRDDQMRFISVGRYLHSLGPQDTLAGSVLLDAHADRDTELFRKFERLATDALQALELRDTVFHLEAFDAPGGLAVFGECAARPGGMALPPLIKHAYGVDLHEEHARISVGLESGGLADRMIAGRSSGMVWLRLPAGRVKRVPGGTDLARRPGVVESALLVAEGDLVIGPTERQSAYVGTAVVDGGDPDRTLALCRDLHEWFAAQATTTRTAR